MTTSTEDPYSGFNDYDHAYDTDALFADKEFVRAAARSSHSRRLPTGARQAIGSRLGTGSNQLNAARLPTASALRSSLASRRIGNEVSRPMTAVRGAGFTSAGRKSTFEGVKAPQNGLESHEDSVVKKIKELENKCKDLLVESVMASDRNEMKLALDKAKEANRVEQNIKKMKRDAREPENIDLALSAQLTLACQHVNNNMISEAINTYEVILSDESFANVKRLNVNLGNLYFRRRDYPTALKYYQKALDRVPQTQRRMQSKILNNIGVAQIKRGKYESGRDNFSECLKTEADYHAALNLVLACYCLDDAESMKDAFQRLVDIPTMVDDSTKPQDIDILAQEAMNNDMLKKWERQRKQLAENTIMTAAKVISPRIAKDFHEGYEWCLGVIKQSIYAGLATELEMNKAVEMLKRGDLETATEALLAFNNKENKVASASANNLAMLTMMQGKDHLNDAAQFAEQSLSLDRYNSNALVNRGNVYHLQGNHKSAIQCYREALQIEPACIQALFNLGLLSKETNDLETAINSYYKLRSILPNNVQVLIQLASLYEGSDKQQAIDFYSDASSLAPNDPAILYKLGQLYDSMGDKSAAFNYMNDSYRLFPANIEVIKWLGNYYIDSQIPESAIRFFEKAAIMEPHNVEWYLLMAGCQRRAGQLQKSLEVYKQTHLQFPQNVECLKFLVQLSRDLRMLEEQAEYEKKLRRLDQGLQRRSQRETDSSQSRRLAVASPNTLPPPSRNSSVMSAPSRQHSAKALLEVDGPYRPQKRDITDADLAYDDPVAPQTERPRTGFNSKNADPFDMSEFGADDLLPD
ncbi:unnamed protein product [Bursaphelenchus xylophilus]|uniref:(pine wood nematode) hypothetical protein n=1 Tax=Bursaphelenchus xylophilus TaxID=6326 RepID=A0A1I7RVK2_BURXY|nr:unnamed protein product [Bursaphelenchus xylophilus]CAG9081797.1 unnamed protein product [Bursaphelenchus xylophilus]